MGNPDRGADTYANGYRHSNTDGCSYIHAYSYADRDTYTDSNTYGHSYCDRNSYSHSYSYGYTHADAYGHCYIHSNPDGNGNSHLHTYAYSDGHLHTYAYSNGNGNGHRYVYADSYSDSNSYGNSDLNTYSNCGEVFADAQTGSNDTATASVVSSAKWELLKWDSRVILASSPLDMQAARAVEKAFARLRQGYGGQADAKKSLPVNVDGAIGAILADLGMNPATFNGIFMIARTPGLVAHVIEEQTREKPMRRIDPVNHGYDGPPARRLAPESSQSQQTK